MTKYIKTHWKDIALSLIVSFIFAHFLGLVRPYKAFGGEDLLPIMVAGYWLFRYLEVKESEEK